MYTYMYCVLINNRVNIFALPIVCAFEHTLEHIAGKLYNYMNSVTIEKL